MRRCSESKKGGRVVISWLNCDCIFCRGARGDGRDKSLHEVLFFGCNKQTNVWNHVFRKTQEAGGALCDEMEEDNSFVEKNTSQYAESQMEGEIEGVVFGIDIFVCCSVCCSFPSIFFFLSPWNWEKERQTWTVHLNIDITHCFRLYSF